MNVGKSFADGEIAIPVGLPRNNSGASAVEFAFVAPVLLLLLLGGFDLGRFILATQRVQAVANSVAEMIAETPASSSALQPGDGVVSANDLNFYMNSAMFTFPDVLPIANAAGTNWWNLLSVQLSSIEFVAQPAGCTSACTYVAKVVWSSGARTCGSTIVSVSDTNTYSPTTLPADLFQPGSVIVVDVSYTWTPTIGSAYLLSIPIERSVYLPPRNVPIVESQATGVANPCPGTP